MPSSKTWPSYMLGPNCTSSCSQPCLGSKSTKGQGAKPQTWHNKRYSPIMLGPRKGFTFQVGHMKVRGSELTQCVSSLAAVHWPPEGRALSQPVTGKREQRDLQL